LEKRFEINTETL